MAALDIGTVCAFPVADVPGTTPTAARANFEDVGAEVVQEVRDVWVHEDVVTIDAQEPTDVGVVAAGLVVAKVAEDPPVTVEEFRAVRAFPIRTTVRDRNPKAALFYFPGCGCGLNSSHLRMSRYLEKIRTPLTASTVGWDVEFLHPAADGWPAYAPYALVGDGFDADPGEFALARARGEAAVREYLAATPGITTLIFCGYSQGGPVASAVAETFADWGPTHCLLWCSWRLASLPSARGLFASARAHLNEYDRKVCAWTASDTFAGTDFWVDWHQRGGHSEDYWWVPDFVSRALGEPSYCRRE